MAEDEGTTVEGVDVEEYFHSQLGVSKPYTTLPNEQAEYALFAAKEEGVELPELDTARSFVVEGNDTSQYVGVDPVYQNYADDTHKPLAAEGGIDGYREEKALNPDNFAYGELQGYEGSQTVGTGSSMPHVLPGTSGEAVEGTHVEQPSGEQADNDRSEGREEPPAPPEPPKSTAPKNADKKND